MKKLLTALLITLIVLLPVFATAQNSPSNQDIADVEVTEVVPENEDEEVVPPVVDIVPDTPETTELQEEMKTVFRLKIYYVYLDGSTAAATYDVMLQAGTEYSVPSPAINGYTASIQVVSGVMPGRDVEYTVVYFSPEDKEGVFPYSEMPELFHLEDYEVPAGLGYSISNVGICFE